MRTQTRTDTPAEFNMCLAQADVLLLLSQALRRPDAEAIQDLDQGDVTELLSAAGFSDDGTLDAAFCELLRHAHATSPDRWRAEFHRLFDGAMLCPPNEAAYVRRDKGAILGDISGFYRAFGFVPSGHTGERPDHIATLLEFAGVLLVMRARAAWDKQTENEQVACEALHAFAQDHIDPWLDAFVRRLSLVAEPDFFTSLAAALSAAWDALMRAHGIARVQQLAADEPLQEPEDISSCGLAEAEHAQEAVSLRISASRSPSGPPHSE